MQEQDFNLLEQGWIRVLLPDCSVTERSLTDVLVNAHQYARLSGELPTQDVAILRLLLAVLHTVFSRTNENGDSAVIATRPEAVRRWGALWAMKRFPEQIIRDYLGRYINRFNLFDPKYPFYQVPAARKGTPYKASKLNGEISESENKTRIFSMRSEDEKDTLTYAEAARWLVYINAFDDNSPKVGKGTGLGWCGQLGNIYALGCNLFETLMLNLVLLKDGSKLWDEANLPYWEKPFDASVKERRIAIPDNQAELLTLQSRRIILIRNCGVVTGYRGAGGDFFDCTAADTEQMTLWQIKNGKKNEAPRITPRLHSQEHQIWRDFDAIVPKQDEEKTPGLVNWLFTLQMKGCIPYTNIALRAVGLFYDKPTHSSIADLYNDHIDFSAKLLTQHAVDWVSMIQRQITLCEKAAGIIGKLSNDLSKAAGKKYKEIESYDKERYYSNIDTSFRNWLTSIQPSTGAGEEQRNAVEIQWRKQAYRIALHMGRDMVSRAGEAAFIGRWIETPPKSKIMYFFSSPTAYSRFRHEINQCFEIQGIKEGAHG